MNTSIRIVILLLITLCSGTVFGQKANPNIFNEQIIKTYSGLRSASLDTSFKVNLPFTKPSKFPFSYQFPTIALNDDQNLIEPKETTTYRYNMPIVRPDKTSKILIAKLDPNFPYRYTMPILKNEGGDE